MAAYIALGLMASVFVGGARLLAGSWPTLGRAVASFLGMMLIGALVIGAVLAVIAGSVVVGWAVTGEWPSG